MRCRIILTAVFILFLLPPIAARADGVAQQRVGYFAVPTPQGLQGICFVWHPGDALVKADAGIEADMIAGYPSAPPPYYWIFSYRIPPDKSSIEVTGLWQTNPQTRSAIAPGSIVAPLYPQPQPGWPCTPQNLAAQGFVRQFRNSAVAGAPLSGSGGMASGQDCATLHEEEADLKSRASGNPSGQVAPGTDAALVRVENRIVALNCPGPKPSGMPARIQNILAAAAQERVAYFQVPTPTGVDRLCFVWHGGAGRATAYVNPAMSAGFPATRPYYQYFDYDTDGRSHLTVGNFISATAPGAPNPTRLKVRLYDAPQPGWPCTPVNWQRLGYDRDLIVSGPQGFSVPASVVPVGDRSPAYYGLAVLKDIDSVGQPIMDGSGRQMTSHLCLLWKPDWRTEAFLSIDDKDNFYKAFSYTVDPVRHLAIVTGTVAPTTVVEGGRLEAKGGFFPYQAAAIFPLSAKPQPGWPCTESTWKDLEAAYVRSLQPPPGGGFHPVTGSISHGPNINWCGGLGFVPPACRALQR